MRTFLSAIINNNNLFNDGCWGTTSTYTRKWMNIRRTYGILDIYRMGYENVWCVDAESFPLSKFSIKSILNTPISIIYFPYINMEAGMTIK